MELNVLYCNWFLSTITMQVIYIGIKCMFYGHKKVEKKRKSLPCEKRESKEKNRLLFIFLKWTALFSNINPSKKEDEDEKKKDDLKWFSSLALSFFSTLKTNNLGIIYYIHFILFHQMAIAGEWVEKDYSVKKVEYLLWLAKLQTEMGKRIDLIM